MSVQRRSTSPRPDSRPPFWVVAGATAFVLYFSLLVAAELVSPVPAGLRIRFGANGASVVSVVPGSPAAEAGVRAGDRILQFAGRDVGTRIDWSAVEANLQAGAEVPLRVRRGDTRLSGTLTLRRRTLAEMLGVDRLVLAAARLTQFAALLLAVLVGVRRPGDPVARLGVWVLAAVGVSTFVLPVGFAQYWRTVPLVVRWVLWGPYVTAITASVAFFLFCGRFPTPLLRARTLAVSSVPAVGMVAWHAWYGYVVIVEQALTPIGYDASALVVATVVAYAASALGVLAWQYGRVRDASAKRRLRVLGVGTLVGCAAGALVNVLFWVGNSPELTSSLLASPMTLVAVPLTLAFPGAVAYTILRHRVFDVPIILRQGVRYALARRLILSAVPVFVAAIVVDVLVHGQQPVGEVLARRGWAYAIGVALAFVASARRGAWLDWLDRHFYRERYRSERILRKIAEDLRAVESSDIAVAGVVREVAGALQPEFVAALGWRAGDDGYVTIAAEPAFDDARLLPPTGRLVALARVLARPLDLSPDRRSWLAEHLHPADIDAIIGTRIELLVPVSISSDRHVLVVLGPRRSQEPYSRDDVDLLAAIAANLALVLDRTAPAPEPDAMLAECPRCGKCFDTSLARCADDDTLLMVTDLPPVLNGRYRLVRLIGAGGMGTVYGARDDALGRAVAIKVLSGGFAGNEEAAQRLRTEARMAAAFTHPNVVTIHDVGAAPQGQVFVVMEQLEGRTLREALVAGAPLDVRLSTRVLRELCDVLEVAHRRGIVHRDLKPENVFLVGTADGEHVKVLDFGIARATAIDDPLAGPTKTAAGLLLGSVPYMSPEQLRGEAVTPSWDLWALGVIASELFTGRRPAPGLTDMPAPETPRAEPSPAPPLLAAFLTDAVSLDPERRPRSAADFLDRLTAALRAG